MDETKPMKTTLKQNVIDTNVKLFVFQEERLRLQTRICMNLNVYDFQLALFCCIDQYDAQGQRMKVAGIGYTKNPRFTHCQFHVALRCRVGSEKNLCIYL